MECTAISSKHWKAKKAKCLASRLFICIFQLLRKLQNIEKLQIFRNLVQIRTVTCHTNAMLLVISRDFDVCPRLLIFHLTFGLPCTLGVLHNFFFCRLVSAPDGLLNNIAPKSTHISIFVWNNLVTSIFLFIFFFDYNENLNFEKKQMFLFCLCFVYLKCFRIVWMNECIWANERMNIYVE